MPFRQPYPVRRFVRLSVFLFLKPPASSIILICSDRFSHFLRLTDSKPVLPHVSIRKAGHWLSPQEFIIMDIRPPVIFSAVRTIPFPPLQALCTTGVPPLDPYCIRAHIPGCISGDLTQRKESLSHGLFLPASRSAVSVPALPPQEPDAGSGFPLPGAECRGLSGAPPYLSPDHAFLSRENRIPKRHA